MKKLIGTVAVALLVATAAFAEVSIGTWLGTMAVPVAYDGDDVKAGMANSWGWGSRTSRFDISINSEDGKAGAVIQQYFDFKDGWGGQDQSFMWVKPVDPIKVSLGDFDHNALRGDMCYGSWNWVRPMHTDDDEGLTFSGQGGQGLLLEVTPIEALYFYAFLPYEKNITTDAYKVFEGFNFAAGINIGDIGKVKVGWFGSTGRNRKGETKYQAMYNSKATDWNKDSYKAKAKAFKFDDKWYYSKDDVDKAVKKYTEKYEADITKYKEREDGSWTLYGTDDKDIEYYMDVVTKKENGKDVNDGGKDKIDYEWSYFFDDGEAREYGAIEVAFDLTAVENLFVTVGARINIAEDAYKDLNKVEVAGNKVTGYYDMVKIALGVSYNFTEAFKLSVSGAFHINNDDDYNNFWAGVGLDFGITDNLTLNADFRISKILNDDFDPAISFLVGAQYAVGSNAFLGIGFQGLVKGEGFLNNCKGMPAQDDFTFVVPIRMVVSIW